MKTSPPNSLEAIRRKKEINFVSKKNHSMHAILYFKRMLSLK
jgi:hypothetical protein